MKIIFQINQNKNLFQKSRYIFTEFLYIACVIYATYKIFNITDNLAPNVILILFCIYTYIIYGIYFNFECYSFIFNEIIIYEDGEVKLKGFKYLQSFETNFNIHEVGYAILKVYTAKNNSKHIIFKLQNHKYIYISENVEETYDILKEYFSDKELKSKMAIQIL